MVATRTEVLVTLRRNEGSKSLIILHNAMYIASEILAEEAQTARGELYNFNIPARALEKDISL